MLNRRSFMGLAGATAVMATLPGSVAKSKPALVATDNIPDQFGYSIDGGEIWYTGYASRAEALDAARGELMFEDITVQVAEAGPIPICYSERPSEILMEEILYNGRSAGQALVDDLVSCNESGDYEGEFECDCNSILLGPIDQKAREAAAAALRRVGLEDHANLVLAGNDLPETDIADEVFDALNADEELNTTLLGIMRGLVEEHGLEASLRGVWTKNVEEVILQDAELAMTLA